jgi:hypothetical protein
MTTYNITDAQIRDLREGADQAYDREQVAICEIALGWDADVDETLETADGRRIADMTRDEARAECARVLTFPGE